MSAGGSSSDQPVDLLQKLSLDSDTKPVENPEVANKAVYGDNSSLPYQQGYNNVPYGAYPSPSSPVPIVGLDGQLLGLQEYHYPSPYYQSVTQTSRPFGPNQAGTPQVEVPTSIAAEQVSLSVEATKGNPSTVLNGGVVSGNKESNQLRPSFQNPSPNLNSSYGRGGFPTGTSLGYQDPRFSSDGSHLSSGRNNNVQVFPHFMNAHHARPTSGLGQSYGFMNHMYPNHGMYGHYGNMMGAGTGFGSFGYDSWKNGQCWYSIDNKYKNRSRSYGVTGYGKENADGLNELNRGPRAKGFKNQEGVGPATLAVKEQNVPNSGNKKENNLPLPSDMQQYNRDDFPENYSHAKFFVIKSYSEDDIHKSIKYNVWSSTPNGNKRLDAAYHEANEKPDGCPIFLFFSVNTSGQFVGIAEMVGPVDFNKTVEYWQQDKWIGCFPVKWHFIKDLPNSLLRHITLENNENKPVTNSRDTQEVKFEQGIQIIKIFKDHSSKTSILDDFGFYEARQKILQEKKGKQQQSQKQVLDGKPDDNKVTDNKEKNMMKGEDRSQKPLDAILQEEPIVETVAKGVEVNGEPKLFQEKGSTVALEDTSEGAVPVVLSEKKVTSNGVASAC